MIDQSHFTCADSSIFRIGKDKEKFIEKWGMLPWRFSAFRRENAAQTRIVDDGAAAGRVSAGDLSYETDP